MKLFPLLLLSLFTLNLSAQTIGDDALKRAQQGQVSFLEGEFIAYLSDTVSPGYVTAELAERGFEVLSSSIEPVQIKVFYGPADSTLNKLGAHPAVTELRRISARVDTAQIMAELLELGIPMSQRETALQRMINASAVPEFILTFDYAQTERSVKQIMGTFRNVAYDILPSAPRTARIKAEPGNEPWLMDKIEELPFVESTAMIAVLDE